MPRNYCIVHTPLIFDLMELVHRKDLTFSHVFHHITGKPLSGLSGDSYLSYLEFDREKKRLGLMDYSGMAFYALHYIANQIVGADPSMTVYISDGNGNAIPEIILREQHPPQAVFISSLSANFPASAVTSVILNQARVPVVLGGIHISARTEDADRFIRPHLLHPDLFSTVKGPGDSYVIQKILKEIRNNTLKPSYTGVVTIENGVWGSKAIIPPPKPEIPFFRNIPLVGAYLEKNLRPIVTTPYLGCPYSCHFCSISTLPKNQRSFVARDPDDFIDEIRSHQARGVSLSSRYFMFLPDNLLLGGPYLERLLDKMIKARLKLNYTTQISIDVAKKKGLIEKLRLSGATHFLIGFESLIMENLENVGKSVALEIKKSNKTVADYYSEQIQAIRQYGISIIGAFIFGMPFDYFNSLSDHSGRDIVRFCHRNRIGIQAACLNDLPGSINFEESQKNNTFLYGKKESVAYLAGLTTADLTECNREMPESLHKSPLVAFYLAYDTITRTNSLKQAAANTLSLLPQTLTHPTLKARRSIREKGYDCLGLFGYFLGITGYRAHFMGNAFSKKSVKGIFERLYEEEESPVIRRIFREYVKSFVAKGPVAGS